MNVQPQRIFGFDLARALAIFGMVFVNFRLVMAATAETPLGNMFATMFDGRAAALFVILAGVGVSLMAQQARANDGLRSVRITLLKRSALLLIVGMLFTPIWPPDILHFYGVYLFVAAWLLAASNRTLLALTIVSIAVAIGLLLTLDYAAGWKNFESLDYTDFWTPTGFIRNTLFNGFHPFFPWIGYVFFGMWLGRQPLERASTCWRFVVLFSAIAVATEVGSDALLSVATSSGEITADDAQALLGTAMMPPSSLYLLSAMSTATVVICLCCRIGATWPDSVWLKSLVSTGQLALTHYAAHVVIGMTVLDALGMIGSQSILNVIVASHIFCIAAVVFSCVWRSRYKRGPLEFAFRVVAGS